MPRGRLNEKHVQRVAVDHLTLHYQARDDALAVVGEIETVVRAGIKAGSGRADGLVVSQRRDGTIYTAALEAKSSRTLLNISPWYDDERWILHAILAGGFGILAAILAGWYVGSWIWMSIFTVVGFFGVGFAYLLVTREHNRYRLIDVVQQVKRYPANEQWIAISSDAYNLLGPQQETLRLCCRREGIGLLQVRSINSAQHLEAARPRVNKKRMEFLEFYARSDIIRRKLYAKAEETRNQSDLSKDPLL